MDILLSILSWILMSVGAFFVFAGAIGVWRFPDFCCRIHVVCFSDSLGAELIIFGLIVQAFVLLDGSAALLIAVKLLIIGLFLFFTSPTSTHAIANAAHTAKLKPFLGAAARRPLPNASKDAGQKEG